MSWLDVPHLKQTEPGWCLPACVSMVAAYWQQPLLQEDVARWLGTGAVGTAASRVTRLEGRGFQVTYRVGSAGELAAWLAQGAPASSFCAPATCPIGCWIRLMPSHWPAWSRIRPICLIQPGMPLP